MPLSERVDAASHRTTGAEVQSGQPVSDWDVPSVAIRVIIHQSRSGVASVMAARSVIANGGIGPQFEPAAT